MINNLLVEFISSCLLQEENFVSDIGGQLGLWVGMSVLSLAEVLELVVLIIVWCSSKKGDMKTDPNFDEKKGDTKTDPNFDEKKGDMKTDPNFDEKRNSITTDTSIE